MLQEEIIKELSLTYEDLVKYLLKKYGKATGDYFRTPDCNSKNKKIVRTSEGLYCHHIDEDKGGNLSNSISAKSQPFEWQKKERLVYCNVLEHLILHIKIAVLRQKHNFKEPADIRRFFSTGGIFMLCKEINDMFLMSGTQVPYKQRCYKEFSDNYAEYICLLKTILFYIQTYYKGDKNTQPFFKYGTDLNYSGIKGSIVDIKEDIEKIFLKMDSGEIKDFPIVVFEPLYTYADQMEQVRRRLSSGFYGNIENISADISKDYSQIEKEWSQLLLIDYRGYGNVQFAKIALEKNIFGSESADEYISKAYPACVDSRVDIREKQVEFWKGNIPDIIVSKDYFYIIRIETSFIIKNGETPFVRYKEFDLCRMPELHSSNESNYLQRSVILHTSDIYSKKTNSHHAKYIDLKGNICDATVKLTFTKEDFELFKQKHYIRILKILDGCYFI